MHQAGASVLMGWGMRRQVFREGLTDLMAICDIVNDSFAVELERFRKKKGKRNSGARPMDTD
jgi:hypothetical protein